MCLVVVVCQEPREPDSQFDNDTERVAASSELGHRKGVVVTAQSHQKSGALNEFRDQ